MTNDCSTDSSSSCNEEEQTKKSVSGAQYWATKKTNAIIARPHASPGYWLCCLLPLAFSVSYFKQLTGSTTNRTQCGLNVAAVANFKMLTIASLGMCVESLCFFMYMFVDTALLLKLFISIVPGLLTTLLYSVLLQKSLGFGFFWGFAVTFCYQNAYIRVMRSLPRCFSLGEACVLVQGVMLFLMNCVLQLPLLLFDKEQLHSEFSQLNAIMMSALFCLLLTCCLLSTLKSLRHVYCFYPLMCMLLLAVMFVPVTKPLPIVTLFQFILSDQRRLCIIFVYLALVGATIFTIFWQLRNSQKASTRVRKIFHVLVVLVYVPGLLYQCTFLYIASGVALAIFTVLELFRILDIAPLSNVLKSSFTSFCDEKDAGGIALTPFCLLIGISLPLWISPCTCSKQLDTAAGANLLPLMAGILSIGFGDTAASVIGSKFGRLKWKNSSRSLEGTFAFVIAASLAVYALYAFGFTSMSNTKWLITATAILVSALVEAQTNQIDNLVLPFIFYIIASLA